MWPHQCDLINVTSSMWPPDPNQCDLLTPTHLTKDAKIHQPRRPEKPKLAVPKGVVKSSIVYGYEEIQKESGRKAAEQLEIKKNNLYIFFGSGLGPHTVLQVRAWFQNEEPSSKLKRTPPMGAPNAAATPAAAPLDTKSRLSLWECKKNTVEPPIEKDMSHYYSTRTALTGNNG